jgi:hypothetical protein
MVFINLNKKELILMDNKKTIVNGYLSVLIAINSNGFEWSENDNAPTLD